MKQLYHLPQIASTVSQEPENLLFFTTSDLIAAAENTDNRFSKEVRIACIAELSCRWYLKPSDPIVDVFDKVLGKEWYGLRQIQSWEILAPLTSADLPKKLWSGSSEFSVCCEIAVRNRLNKLLDTDGFIPVYIGQNAFFLPFSFIEKTDSCIVDAAGKPLAEWEEAYCTLFGKKPQFSCKVGCCQNRVIRLTGQSFMLPLYLAYQRTTGVLTAYNRLRLLSTGQIVHGHLQSVEVPEKLHGFHQYFSDATFFFPESSTFPCQDSSAVPLNTSLTLNAVLKEIQKQMDARGLVVPTFQEAIGRLKELETEIRQDNHNRWEMMLARLDNNIKAIPETRDQKSHLLYLMLKSAVYCHMGDTWNALECNAKAKQLARELGAEQYLRRLEIEELVEFQDIEDFESLLNLANVLNEDLLKLKDDDLLMRYHGTMGQAHSYGSLAGISGFDRNAAKTHFQQALLHAERLNSEQDIAQDLNYLYSWHVLFCPGTQEEAIAYQNARAHVDRNLRDFPECRKKNRYYLERFRMQSLYRQLLLGMEIPPEIDESSALPEDAAPWLRALVEKYLGAILAAKGMPELADQCFRKGARQLKPNSDHDILAYIRMTILAEAFHSLGGEERKKEALKALHPFREHFSSAESWWMFLEEGGPYPALHYWY